MINADLVWITLPILGLAWVNGANDVAKGVSTLIGSGIAQPSRAIGWGTGRTLLGGGAAIWRRP